MMKLSAPDWCFYKEDMEPAAYYEKLGELGYSGVEMVDPARWPAARAAGLEILNLAAPGIERGLNRRQHHPELVLQIRGLIALAGENDIPHIIVYSGARAGQPDEEGIKICRECIEQLLPDASKAGVTLVFEMLNTCDHPDHQASRSSFGFALADKVSSPRLRILYDIYHMERMGDDGAADIIAHLPLISHLHVAQSPGRDSPGAAGEIRYDDIVPRVVAAGYKGWWGMEFVPGPEAMAELAEAAALFNDLASKA
jgi:hydroxypyruvate isomerase